MKLFKLGTAAVLLCLLAACASAPKPVAPAGESAARVQGQASIDDTPAMGANAAAQAATPITIVESTSTESAPAQATVATPSVADASTNAEDDYAAIYGEAPYNPVADPNLPEPVQIQGAYDPWEKYNRKMHAFNNVIDRAVARPLARAYSAVAPRVVRLGVSNFFDNLRQPLSAFNYLLQGHPLQAGQALSRFVINSTLGIAGIFDPASDAKLPRGSEDFGQTLGVWGWKKSRYVELPLFGPRTVRDVIGMAGDIPLSPVRQISEDRVRIFLQGLQLVDTRAQLLSLDSLREGAVDDYSLVRDSWSQRRNYQIESGRRQQTDDTLPDYLLEEDSSPTVPVDAMPMPEITPGD